MTVETSRRDVLLGSTAGAAAAALALGGTAFAQSWGAPVSIKPRSATPSIVYFLVDNLGYGELGCLPADQAIVHQAFNECRPGALPMPSS